MFEEQKGLEEKEKQDGQVGVEVEPGEKVELEGVKAVGVGEF